MTLSLNELERKLPNVLARRQSPDLFRGSPLGPQLSYGRHRGPSRKRSRQAAVLAAIYLSSAPASSAPASNAPASNAPASNAPVGNEPGDAKPVSDEDSLVVVLTRRPTTLAHHGGQVCLPGGRIEAGETPLEACLREFHEELGVKALLRHDLGTLPPMYVFASDNHVTSHVVTIESPQRPWTPDPGEVDTVLEVPLSQLRQVAARDFSTAADDRVEIIERTVDRRGKPQSPKDNLGVAISLSFSYRAIQFQQLRTWHVEPDTAPVTTAHLATHQIWGATALLLEQLAVAVEQAISG